MLSLFFNLSSNVENFFWTPCISCFNCLYRIVHTYGNGLTIARVAGVITVQVIILQSTLLITVVKLLWGKVWSLQLTIYRNTVEILLTTPLYNRYLRTTDNIFAPKNTIWKRWHLHVAATSLQRTITLVLQVPAIWTFYCRVRTRRVPHPFTLCVKFQKQV